jgi:hypothetical protein
MTTALTIVLWWTTLIYQHHVYLTMSATKGMGS